MSEVAQKLQFLVQTVDSLIQRIITLESGNAYLMRKIIELDANNQYLKDLCTRGYDLLKNRTNTLEENLKDLIEDYSEVDDGEALIVHAPSPGEAAAHAPSPGEAAALIVHAPSPGEIAELRQSGSFFYRPDMGAPIPEAILNGTLEEIERYVEVVTGRRRRPDET